MAMNDRDVLGRDWDAMVRDMERSRRVEPRRMPWISEKQPYTKVEEAPDPDEMVLDLILGKGTGDWKKDLAFGLMGPAGGAATEISGGQSGVLDWLPGAGVAKAGAGAAKALGVLAVPRLANIVRSATKSTGQDLAVDALRRAAQNTIDRLSRVTDHVVTHDEIAQAVADEVRAMGDMSDAPKMRMYATEIAEDVLNRAQESLAEGRAPDLIVRSIPPYMNLGYKATEAANEASKARSGAKQWRDRTRALYNSLSDEEKNEIEQIARARQREHYRELLEQGIDEQTARKRAEKIYSTTKFGEAGKRETASRTVDRPTKEFVDIGSNISNDTEAENLIRKAGAEAYRRAMDEAIANGIDKVNAQKIGNLARQRAAREMTKTVGGDAMQSRLDVARKASANVRKAFDILPADIKEEIEATANAKREEVRALYLANGATGTTAKTKARDAYTSSRNSETRRFLKELGFKNANDPRLAQYSQLSRDGNHVLATPTEQVLMAEPNMTPFRQEPAMAEAAAPVKGYVADVVEGAGKSMLDGIPDEEVEALLREYGETPTADRVFNREYLEELLREEGY